MLRSLYSAVSGIDVNQKAMDVIGNNIANVNTIGFKQGRAVFQDMLSQTLQGGKAPSDSRGGVNPRQVGTGAYLVSVDNIFSQGVIKATARTHDLAIEGNGFFVVRGEGDEKFYTRAGDFNFDTSGSLTTPSGYRVQGWMADPVSGEIRMNAIAEDILISEAHKTMQARATTQIDYAGILNTQASASEYKFNKMLTQASGTQDIFSLYSYKGNGAEMDLNRGDTIRVRAHATGMTRFSEIANESGSLANISNGSQIIFRVDDQNFNLVYDRNAADTAGTNSDLKFSTLQGLVDELNNTVFGVGGLNNGAVASIEEGKLVVTGGANPFEINSVTGDSTVLSGAFDGLTGTYHSSSKSSKELFYQTDLNAGEDFESLNDLSGEITEALNGHVVSSGFTAEYMDNNFGLKPGDKLNMTMMVDGEEVIISAIYSATPLTPGVNPPNDFHSLSELATLIQTQIKEDADFLATDPARVTVSADGDSLSFNYLGTETAEITFSGVETFALQIYTATGTTGYNNIDTATGTYIATAPSDHTSPYLEGLLNSLNGAILNNNSSQTVVADISGKGRIGYYNENANAITGFSIMEASEDSVFDDNILMQQDIDMNAAGGFTTSQQFLTEATEDTLMTDLFSAEDGMFSNFSVGTAIQFHAFVGGRVPTDADSLAVTSEATLGDMMDSLEEYLGLGKSFNNLDNVTIENGVITVVGEKGQGNDISELTLTGVPESTLVNFNDKLGKPTKDASATAGYYETDMPIYDGQGNKHMVSFEFSIFNEERNEWAVRLSTSEPGTSINITGASTNELIVKFNADGTPSYIYDRQSNPEHVISDPTLNLYPANGSSAVTGIDLNLGTTGKYDGLVLSNAPMSINLADQDGYALGVLDEKMFNPAGEIVGYYSNGEIRTIGQVALATFQNDQGLLKAGDTMFAETANSGPAAIGTAQSGSRGQIASSALEQSNVNLSDEFVSMIVTERGFQANSRVVTTSDEMIQELLNLKR